LAWDRNYGPRIRGPGDKPSGWRFLRRGLAKAGPGGSLDVTEGAAAIEGADETLLSVFKDRQQFCLEVELTAAKAEQDGPARIISFSTDAYSRNFTLGQERDWLVLRLRTTSTGLNGQKPEVRLCPVTPGKRQHVLVSYRDGQLACYLDGKLVLRETSVQGDFRNWTAQHLIFGDEWNGGRNWDGTIEHVAIYRRAIGWGEANGSGEAAGASQPPTAAQSRSDMSRDSLAPSRIAADPTPAADGIAAIGTGGVVELTIDGVDESAGGLACYRITTPAATYYLEKTGAGLSSLVDRDGNDWLGFHPRAGSGPAGAYRGFPNAVHQQQGSYFHAGNDGENSAVTKVEYAAEDRITIAATSTPGHWACRYDFFPTHCTFTMTRMPEGCKYWVLYEGTPGGQYNDDDWWMTAQGDVKHPLTERHDSDIPAPEWIGFGDCRLPRALVLLHHQDDAHPDRFYQMQSQMTVFGFGRDGLNKYLDSVPQSVSILLVDSPTHARIQSVVQQVLETTP
jgi:hypothetical protein